MITLDNVSKRYDNFYAVRDLSFSVEEGELCCLIGPSGCGKSTALKMINRMVEPSNGAITIKGRDIRKVPAEKLRRNIGYVIQSIGLFPHMTVMENILVVPRLLKWGESQCARRGNDLLELLELDPREYAGKYPAELSGGQAQRIGVARALAADPEILLMDEPFGALDPINREHLQNQFLTIQKELRKTIVFVTHDIDEAVRLGTKVALLREGRLVQYAPPEQILSSPVNTFVKKFVGLDRALKRLSRFSTGDFIHPAHSVTRQVKPEALVAQFRHMEENQCARYLWVTEEDGRLVGWIDGYKRTGYSFKIEDDLVEVDLSEVSVRGNYSLKQTLSMFVQQGVVCLPVVDEQYKLQGEIRLVDVLES
ncbi:ATP-binding cassette domain-containing protein [Desulfopila inferna]|uniref:ATP-binding cassette domain-containing protein n=1 Tax=Desulfopila inferna TaxID=468528 RepID=UPI0019661FFD|nr:ATP-binding cassette domain-containing protein [Desulfopila inferna]MBM9603953.1 ATP-binding cassette domain-containing protein [Desulfopila inferna]